MKKNKEFWVDSGYLDVLGSNQPAAKVVLDDALGAGQEFLPSFFPLPLQS